jgi:site-specific recombinase XerD
MLKIFAQQKQELKIQDMTQHLENQRNKKSVSSKAERVCCLFNGCFCFQKPAQNTDMKSLPRNQKGNVPIVWHEKRRRWQLSTRVEGRERRQYFRERVEAERVWREYCRCRQEHGRHSLSYSAAAHAEYEEAKRIVGGADLRDVAREYAARVTLSQMSVDEAVTQFLAFKEQMNLARLTLAGLRSNLSQFARVFDGHAVADITGNAILEWLLAKHSAGADARTVTNIKISLNNFFNWCVRREILRVSPTANLHESDLPVIVPKPRLTLTVDQTEAMLSYLEEHEPAVVPWHVVQLFGGIRREEAGRLTLRNFDIEREVITLEGWDFSTGTGSRLVKTGDNWTLHDLPANLWQWLRAYLPRPPHQWVVPTEGQIAALRHRIFPTLTPPIKPWGKNCMRHTFCSMLISYHSDAAKVANWSRHSSPQQLYHSYVTRLVSKQDAARFLSIAPRLRGIPRIVEQAAQVLGTVAGQTHDVLNI